VARREAGEGLTFTPKTWGNFLSGGTPLNAAALVDLETRLAAYTDAQIISAVTSNSAQLFTHRQGVGISTGHDPYIRDTATNTANINQIRLMGADTIRITIEWSSVQAINSATFDWTIPDLLFDLSIAQGLTVLFILIGSPAWARTAGEPTNSYPPTDVSTFGTFCTAAATRYKNRGIGCHTWEVWNEPNGNFGFGSTDYSPQKYVDLIGAAYTAIKAVDSAAVIVLGGIDCGGGAENLSGNGVDLDINWLRKQYLFGVQGKFDVLGIHPYAKGIDPADTTMTGMPTGSNLITNPTFDTNTTDWFGDGATISRITSSPTPRTGAGALKILITGGQFSGAHFNSTIPVVVAGTDYLGSAWVQASAADTIHVTLNWYQSDGSTSVGFSQGYDVTGSGTWQYITCRGTAPVGATRCGLAITDSNATPNGHSVYVDDVALNTTTSTAQGWNRIDQLRALMVTNGDVTKPIWVTEVGQCTGTGTTGVSEGDQAAFLGDMFQRMREFPYVQRFYWHQDIDGGSDTTDDDQNYGLRTFAGAQKLAFGTFRDSYI
jgi:hypothetical protein